MVTRNEAVKGREIDMACPGGGCGLRTRTECDATAQSAKRKAQSAKGPPQSFLLSGPRHAGQPAYLFLLSRADRLRRALARIQRGHEVRLGQHLRLVPLRFAHALDLDGDGVDCLLEALHAGVLLGACSH